MSVVPFRQASPAAPKARKPLTIEERVNGKIEGIEDLDLSQVMRIDGAEGEDGSAQITYTPELELRLRQLVARFGMPRLPFTVAELNALFDYAAYLDGGRADELEQNASWQRHALELAEANFPGYATGLRLYIAQNTEGLLEHHSTRCGYAELIEYGNKYYGRE